MANDSGKTIPKEVAWLGTVSEVWRQCAAAAAGAPDAAQLADALALRLGIAVPIALGLLQACDSLAAYAGAPLEFDDDAIDEERSGNEAARRATLPITQGRLQARVDAHDAVVAGAVKCSICLQNCESRGLVARHWHSTLGRLELRRRWSWCQACRCGVAEAQRWLRLPDGQYTARLSEVISLMATTVPHGMAADLAGNLLGVAVSEHGVQEIVEQRAAPLVALQDAEAKSLNPQNSDGSERQRPRPRDAVKEAPEVAYMEMDGVFPMTRQALPESAVQAEPGARGGKGRRYKLEGKEVKNAVLYTAKDCVRDSDRRGAILGKKYVSHLGNCHDFKLLLWVQMRRMRFDEAKLLVLLSDGADWIRDLSKWLPFSVLLILDLFHAKHRIWEVANALHGDKTPEAKAWAFEQCLRVEAGEVTAVIEALRFLKPRQKQTVELVDALRKYFENNKDRMDYPAYRARGLRVSSAAVESANYHVTGARMKLQGMRWSEQGAAQMARLRADLFNGKWERRTREVMAA